MNLTIVSLADFVFCVLTLCLFTAVPLDEVPAPGKCFTFLLWILLKIEMLNVLVLKMFIMLQQ